MTDTDTFGHAGLTVRIFHEEYDHERANPRGYGNVGVMFCDYRGYTLGDEDAPDPRDQRLTCPQCGGSGEHATMHTIVNVLSYGHEIVKVDFASLATAEAYMERNAPEDSHWQAEPQSCPKCEGEGEVEVSIIEYLKHEHGARVILPLMVYEHSGITMRVGNGWKSSGQFVGDDAGWDTSLVGVIFDTEESRKEHLDEAVTDEQIEKILREEVYYYAAYLEGMVFGYDILDDEDEVIGGCGCFLEPEIHKDDCYIKQEARREAEHCAAQIVREQELAHEWACRDVVTV